MKMAFRTLSMLGLVGLSVLAGCGGFFQSKRQPPAVYLLSVKAAPSGAEIPADLAVLKPRVRIGLDSDLIAVLYPDRHLDYFAGARWSGPLDEVMQDLALQAFRGNVNLRTVHGGASAFGSAYWLEIFVADFQAEYAAGEGASGGHAPTVHVRLLATVGTAGERRVLGRFEAERRQPAAENRLTAVIDAYNQAATAALGEIVAASVETLDRNLGLERR
jgi:cholesterol transport system auxiliary component